MTMLARLLFRLSNKVRRLWCWMDGHVDANDVGCCDRCWTVMA